MGEEIAGRLRASRAEIEQGPRVWEGRNKQDGWNTGKGAGAEVGGCEWK